MRRGGPKRNPRRARRTPPSGHAVYRVRRLLLRTLWRRISAARSRPPSEKTRAIVGFCEARIDNSEECRPRLSGSNGVAAYRTTEIVNEPVDCCYQRTRGINQRAVDMD